VRAEKTAIGEAEQHGKAANHQLERYEKSKME